MGFFIKTKIFDNHPHEVIRKDWENVLDDIFRNVIANSVKGIAIICNTSRQNDDDVEGLIQQELIYHIKQKRADEVRIPLKKLNSEQFEKIFKNYFEGTQKGQDFYRIKNILLTEIMVYPLIKGKTKKSLLVFDYPISESNSINILKTIKNIVN